MPTSKPRWETPKILSDLPLREEDQAHFHFDEFAVTLARLIADPATRTPLTIGVSGAWGSGKTTLLQRVKKLLDTRNAKGLPPFANPDESARNFRKCKTVWFEAWKYNDDNEILAALVRVILDTMHKDGLFATILEKWEDPEQPRYDWVGMFLNAFQLKFGGLGAGLEFKLDPKPYEQESPFKTHTAFFDHFSETFVRLMAAWVHHIGKPSKINEKTGALIIFIDDLDRCLPEMTIKESQVGRVSRMVYKPWVMFLLGSGVTMISMSVSVSLSILVPLSNRGFVRRENVIPYIMGANITTFIDTLMAAVLLGNPSAFSVVLVSMLTIALISLVIILFFFRSYERLILGLANQLLSHRKWLAAYMFVIFAIPILLMFF